MMTKEDRVDPLPVLLHQHRQVLVEVQDDVDEAGQVFHRRKKGWRQGAILPEAGPV
jgi:hypothetical protein